MRWYLEVLKRYGDFSGRARRQEFWNFVLIDGLFMIVLFCLGAALFPPTASSSAERLSLLYGVATTLPRLAVHVRRMHDLGQSGWYLFICLVPVAGPITYLVFLCQAGTEGPNEFGPDPKADPLPPETD